MNADAAPAVKDPGLFSRAVRSYEKLTGLPAVAWLLIALANLALQVILFHELFQASPAEFGILNAALGIIGLLTVPVLAVQQAFQLYPVRPSATEPDAALDSIRASQVPVVETLACIWGGFCVLLLLLPLPPPNLPRFPLQLLALMNVLMALGAVLSHAVSEKENRLRLWAVLLVIAAVARVVDRRRPDFVRALRRFRAWPYFSSSDFLPWSRRCALVTSIGRRGLRPAARPSIAIFSSSPARPSAF